MKHSIPLLENSLVAFIVPLVGIAVLGFELSTTMVSEDPEADAVSSQQTTEYQAKLTPLGDSGVTGTASFTDSEAGFHVQLTAKGLESGQHPQHIHQGSSCDDFQGVLVGLEPFPEATQGGTINYQSNEIEQPENLGDRTVVVHATDGTPVACGAINPLGNR